MTQDMAANYNPYDPFNLSEKGPYNGRCQSLHRLFAMHRTLQEREVIKKVQDRAIGYLRELATAPFPFSRDVRCSTTTLRTLTAVMEYMDMRLTNNREKNPRYQATVSYNQIARKSGCSRRTAIRHMGALAGMGFITIVHRKKGPHAFKHEVNIFRPGRKILELLAKFTAPRTKPKYDTQNGPLTGRQKIEAARKKAGYVRGGGVRSNTDYQEDSYLEDSLQEKEKNLTHPPPN